MAIKIIMEWDKDTNSGTLKTEGVEEKAQRKFESLLNQDPEYKQLENQVDELTVKIDNINKKIQKINKNTFNKENYRVESAENIYSKYQEEDCEQKEKVLWKGYNTVWDKIDSKRKDTAKKLQPLEKSLNEYNDKLMEIQNIKKLAQKDILKKVSKKQGYLQELFNEIKKIYNKTAKSISSSNFNCKKDISITISAKNIKFYKRKKDELVKPFYDNIKKVIIEEIKKHKYIYKETGNNLTAWWTTKEEKTRN